MFMPVKDEMLTVELPGERVRVATVDLAISRDLWAPAG